MKSARWRRGGGSMAAVGLAAALLVDGCAAPEALDKAPAHLRGLATTVLPDGHAAPFREWIRSPGAASVVPITELTWTPTGDDLATMQDPLKAIRQGEFDRIERLLGHVRESGARSLRGDDVFEEILDVLETEMGKLGFATATQLLERWASGVPTSAIPLVLCSRLHITEAWKYRGEEVASEVSSRRLEDFRRLMEAVPGLLDEAERRRPEKVLVQPVRLQHAMAFGERAVAVRAFQAAERMSPGHFPTYQRRLMLAHEK